ncbi:DgyrCDS14587 [Dimorphilus gyrociliatus]|uniref:DgyrCDS14587 n=1 Tax=Dimorphilus gyrociliatus TaxID=2664684 RepID=A0A7I8WE58_9ANNE|nr:DgyrCDS14587 [Dimorphilus gyrociliatus]
MLALTCITFVLAIPEIFSINLARGKMAFQSSTNGSKEYSNFATFATDSTIEITKNSQNTSYCSLTDVKTNEYSWWVVDLGDIYSVSNVCLLTEKNGPEISNFDIILGNSLTEQNALCQRVEDIVVNPLSLNDYQCFKCSDESVGSFLFLKSYTMGTDILLCDIDVKGTLVKKRDFHLLNNTNVQLVGGKHYGIMAKEGATDGNFMTAYHTRGHSAGRYMSPFLLLSFNNLYDFHGVFFIHARDTNYYYRNIYGSVKLLPETSFNADSNFCFYNQQPQYKPYLGAQVWWCDPIYSGKYFLIQQYVNDNSQLILVVTELILYGKLTKTTSHHVDNGGSFKFGTILEIENLFWQNVTVVNLTGKFLQDHIIFENHELCNVKKDFFTESINLVDYNQPVNDLYILIDGNFTDDQIIIWSDLQQNTTRKNICSSVENVGELEYFFIKQFFKCSSVKGKVQIDIVGKKLFPIYIEIYK